MGRSHRTGGKNGEAKTSENDEQELPIKEHRSAIYDLASLQREASHPLIRGVEYTEELVARDKNDPSKGQTFPHGLSFVDVTFRKLVDFNKAVFEGPAYFWNCRFEGGASFFRVRVIDKHQPVHLRLQGEVNFSYCRFEQIRGTLSKPSFDRALFAGPAFFHRTIFRNGVTMEETRFQGGVTFEGSQSDVCVSVRSLEPTFSADGLSLEKLKDQRIVSTNMDHNDHVNFDWKIQNEEGLKRALAKLGDEFKVVQAISWTQTEAELTTPLERSLLAVLQIWHKGYDSTMFGDSLSEYKSPMSSFRGTQFGPKSSCNRVDLGLCLFQGANLSDVEFVVVEWARQPCGLLLRRIVNLWRALLKRNFVRRLNLLLSPARRLAAKMRRQTSGGSKPPRKRRSFSVYRSALYDELLLDSEEKQGKPIIELRTRRKELSELYRGLRIAFDREGDSHTSRDFYFGELEAERLSYRRVRQLLGILFLYKLFSGYSKREGLALGWLLAFIFLIFPALFYVSINRPEHKILIRRYESDWKSGGGSGGGTQTSGSAKSEPPCHLPQAGQVLTFFNGGMPSARLTPGDDAAKKSDQERYNDVMDRALDAAWGNGKLRSIVLRPVTSSLEASTFLPPPGQSGTSVHTAVELLGSIKCMPAARENIYTNAATALAGLEDHKRALEGLERLVLPAQLGLFLLALRSRFQKTR